MSLMATLREPLARLESTQRANDFTDFITALGMSERLNTNAIELLRTNKRATRIVEKDMADRVAAETMSRRAVIEKETIQPLTPTTGAALRQSSQDWARANLRRSPHTQLIERGSLLVPVGTKVAGSTHDAVAAFFGAVTPIVASGADYSAATMLTGQLGYINVYSGALFRFGDDGVRALVNREIANPITKGIGRKLFSADAAVDHVSPAGLRFGVTASGDGSPSALGATFLAAVGDNSGGEAGSLVFFAALRALTYMAAQRVDGSPEFPDINLVTGGSIFGIPVVICEGCGANVVFVNAEQIAFSDDGLEISQSNAAAIQMSNTPTAAAAATVSMFQSNSVALRVVHYVSWLKLATDAVTYFELPIDGSPG